MSTFEQFYFHHKANSKRFGKEQIYGICSSGEEPRFPRRCSEEAGEAWVEAESDPSYPASTEPPADELGLFHLANCFAYSIRLGSWQRREDGAAASRELVCCDEQRCPIRFASSLVSKYAHTYDFRIVSHT